MENWQLLAALMLTCLVLGNLLGTRRERQTIVIVPQETTTESDLGVFARLLVGGVAAILALGLLLRHW